MVARVRLRRDFANTSKDLLRREQALRVTLDDRMVFDHG